MLYPKLFTTLKTYSLRDFFADLIAGLVVGVVALPLAIAFGIASGVSPEKGLITAIVAGFLISVLGGSRVQIGGPTGAFVVIVYGIVQQYGIHGLIIATFLGGILLMLAGALGLGTMIQYIPHPVVVGFTSGIAVVIFSSQIKDFFGLPTGPLPAEFFAKWRIYLAHIHEFNLYAFFIAAGTVLIIAYWPKISRRIPGSLVALVLFSAAVHFFHFPVETIGSRFGELPHSLPMPAWPDFDFGTMRHLVRPAFVIAFLAGIESLLSAVVADGMIGGRHRSNMELVAQGAANIGSALFGGIPATGAIARTVTNIKNGGRTPVAGIVHALTLLFIVIFLGPLAKLIPLACLAGILVVVSYNMSEWRSFLSISRGLKSGAAVLILTFLLTVVIDLTVAIEVGMVLSAFLFMHRMAQVSKVNVIDDDDALETEDEELRKVKVPKGIQIYEINGPFFFGVAHQFEEASRVVDKLPKVRILRMRHVPIIDATGINSLKEFCKRSYKNKIKLLFSGLKPELLQTLKESELYELIGAENLLPDLASALKRAESLLLTSSEANEHKHHRPLS